MRTLIVAIIGLLLSQPLYASPPAGTWVLTAEGRTALVLTISEDARGVSARARILKPAGMQIDDGTTVSGIGPGIDDRILEVASSAGDVAVLRIAGQDQVSFTFTRLDQNHAELVIAMGSEKSRPMVLVSARAAPPLATDWDDRPYAIDARWPDNPEIQRLFAEDQADRADPASIDWSVVGPRDEARRARVRALLDDGKLRSALDFYAAAFIFQHGEEASDFLLAHGLALASAARGHAPATWIAAATLDRYLQKVGQPQIFGTQFLAKKGETASQGAYDRSLVPESLRTALGVPTLAEQEMQRKMWEERMNAKP